MSFVNKISMALIIFCLSCATPKRLPERAMVEPAHVMAAIELEKELDSREGLPIPEGRPWFEVIEGSIPVIITAPHSTRPLREGNRRFSDGGGTAALAVAIGKLTGATVMYMAYEGPSDPNFYDDNQFKRKLKELIERKRPYYVLDLHGSHPYRSYDVDIGTMRGQSLLGRFDLLHGLIEHLKREGIQSISYNRFGASKYETVTKFCSRHGVPAMQVEINTTWISPKKDRIEAQRFAKLLQALARYIKSTQT